ncbi:MAG: carbon-nitrogen hydrolase family protein [Alphaproteobacteria bacterium]|nr:carbon-nitrogen hydrolase family protein [Alphaproteobacteria bacterium]
MHKTLKVACVQMTSGPDIHSNLQVAEKLIREAAAQGARLVATPENTDQMRRRSEDKLTSSGDEHTHAALPFFSALAQELGIWILLGSIGVRVNETQMANRSHLFAPDGTLTARYDKIHMFDAQLSRSEFYHESKDSAAGACAVTADIEGFTLGMSICYDVRFAHLYRDLAKAGANILSVPAAFTVPTGKAHWEILLRARAIETGSYVLAPGQTGEHEGGRQTYGHSLIIGPWGEILAGMDTESGIIFADMDMEEITKARQAIPALLHDKTYRIQP